MTIKANRREVLNAALQGAGVAVLAACGLSAVVKDARSQGFAPLPPGANEGFADQCIKCGLCVKACPYDTLKLARLGDPAPAGTPFFTPRETACYMCEDIPCVRVCPSGALDREFDDIRKARMGIAAIDPNACLSWQGLRCEVCFRICPVKGKAITLDPHPRQLSKHAVFVPVIHPDDCTGCGLCTWSCPTQQPSINIVERKAFLGRIGEHYRLGWRSDQPHHPGVPAAGSSPKSAGQPQAPAAPGGLDYLNSMDDPLQ